MYSITKNVNLTKYRNIYPEKLHTVFLKFLHLDQMYVSVSVSKKYFRIVTFSKIPFHVKPQTTRILLNSIDKIN